MHNLVVRETCVSGKVLQGRSWVDQARKRDGVVEALVGVLRCDPDNVTERGRLGSATSG
jgi:hypothetical protein